MGDVAALAGLTNPYCVAYDGSFGGVGGTSAASPVFGGIITKINSAMIDAGSAPMGFLNQWIYQNPQMFNDVTSGTNDGGFTYGFTAVEGWDPATGFGTPNYGL